jgi:hypothetical protein
MPTPLVELFLIALSASAYHVAETGPAYIEQELAAHQRILRLQDTINIAIPPHLPNGSGFQSQRHDLQYRVVMLQPVAQGYVLQGKTKVLVIPDHLFEAPVESHSLNFDEPISSSEDGNSEINENFLVHTVLGELGIEANFVRSTMAEDFGGHHPLHAKFLAQPLAMPFVDSVHCNTDQDGFIWTADLAKIGIFSGDWVCIL